MKITGPVRALGAMSGTSLDGVDAAVIVTDGKDVFGFEETAYRPYSEAERSVLRAALGQDESGVDVSAAAEVIETAHAEILSGFDDIDVVGFHGQTLLHRPEEKITHQAGSGDVLAEILGVPVVWDFRSADVNLGGEGAPLAPFYHWALARHLKAREPLAFLNIGGVANLTWVDPTWESPETEEALLALDTGPGQAPLNDLMQTRCGEAYDSGGQLAAKGQPDAAVLDGLLELPFVRKMPPKSLDRDDFSELLTSVSHLSDADAASTLTTAIAALAVSGLVHCPTPPDRLLVTGGGRHNATLMSALSHLCACPVSNIDTYELDGDMIEAQAFAYLAVRVARGWPTSSPGTTGIAAPVGGGQISVPDQAPQLISNPGAASSNPSN